MKSQLFINSTAPLRLQLAIKLTNLCLYRKRILAVPLYPEIVEGDNEGDSQEKDADDDGDLMLDLGFGAPAEEGTCCSTFTES